MFNPYGVRPIGSRRFEEHLNEVARICAVKEEEKRSMIPVLPTRYQADPDERRWRPDPMNAGWEMLHTAIIARALVDYLEAYAYAIEFEDNHDYRADVYMSRCLTLENEYFRQDENLEAMFDYILRHVCHRDYKLRDRLDRINRARLNIQKLSY